MIENSWLFPAIEAVHLVGLALLAGTLVLGDLAVLGWAPRIEGLAGWTRGGLAVMIATGLVLFASDAQRYLANPAFWVKMVVLAVLLGTARMRRTRAGAAVSLGLWTAAVVAARAVIDFDV